MKKDLFELLENNSYPGRGIAVGRSADGASAIVLYFIMGRSENSRNRIFTKTDDGIRTEAYDPAKMSDPSLIIYHPVRRHDGAVIVTNGDQTDTIRDTVIAGGTFEGALRTREFEPDGPNYTPRISAVVERDGAIRMSILKSDRGDPECCCRYFYEYDRPLPGVGRFISTYMGDGSPLPSFEGEPVCVAMEGDFDEMAERTWSALNADNKVSLYACEISLSDGAVKERIFNKNGGAK